MVTTDLFLVTTDYNEVTSGVPSFCKGNFKGDAKKRGIPNHLPKKPVVHALAIEENVATNLTKGLVTMSLLTLWPP